MNTLENKAKFFAQYWGQTVFFSMLFGTIVRCESYYLHKDNIQETDYLLLKPLSFITDEDAYYVGASVNCWSWAERKTDWFKDEEMKETHVEFGKMFALAIGKPYGHGHSHPFANNSTDILHGFDYLRSKGYALPWMGLSVETLIEYGWVKFKEVNNG